MQFEINLAFVETFLGKVPLSKKSPYSELFWSTFFPHFPAFIISPYSVRMRENAGKIRTRITPNTDTFYAVSIFREVTSSRFRVTTSTKQLLESTYFFRPATFVRGFFSEQSLLRCSYIFKGATFSEWNFYRVTSWKQKVFWGQVLFWTASFLME